MDAGGLAVPQSADDLRNRCFELGRILGHRQISDWNRQEFQAKTPRFVSLRREIVELFFVWHQTAAPSDRFRTFQIASGVYLAFYVLGHMDSVFIFARTYLGIDTGWSFATGAPTGLVKDPWNIRLVPHYWLGAFFVLAHLAAGARAVMMAHGVSKALADRLMVGGAVLAGLVATVIMLGMCGMRVQFI